MYNNDYYDIAIVGGGLAGLSLAVQSAGAGYKTVLFEKESYPFHKVCGEYISNESYPFLQRLGVDLSSLSLPFINQLLVSDGKGKAYSFPLSSGGFGISRFCLDDLLYQQAIAKGVAVFTNTKITDVIREEDGFVVHSFQQKWKAKVACGAWGKRSNLDVRWQRPFAQRQSNKLNNYIGIKYHIRYPQPRGTIALHNFTNGYCGISAIEENACCLCYLTTANNLKKSNNSLPVMEKELLSQNPFLKSIFSNAVFLYSQPLAISQISFERKKAIENGVLMLGDAAGLITPLCGNGMSMAMHAAAIAFTNIDSFLQKKISRPQLEKQYATQWQQQFGTRLQVGRAVQRLFGGAASTSLFLKALHTFPAAARTLIKATHGTPF